MSVLIIWLILFALVIMFSVGAKIQNKMMDDVEAQYNELKHLTKEKQGELK